MAKSPSRIDERVFRAIWDEAKKTNPNITEIAIYKRIEAVRRKFKKVISTRMAANMTAVEMGIDVYRILKDETELRELRNLIGITPPQGTEVPRESRKQAKVQPLNIPKRVIGTFGLPPNLARDAEKMAEAYRTIYVLENIARYVIMTVIGKRYGRNWWNQPNVVSNEIKREVQRRKQIEGENRWHSRRGGHEIFYTDFGDLSRIISANPNEFRSVFGNLEIGAEMRQLEHSRNIIAHNNPLPPREVERMKIYLGDLRKQLNIPVAEQR